MRICPSDGRAARILALMLALTATGCATGPDRSRLSEGVPQDVQALERKADSARARGDKERALVNYVKALSQDRDNASILYKVATIHREGRNYDVARKGYKQILENSPGHAGALEGLGLIHLAERRLEDAEARLREAIGADPARWRAYNGVGIIADLRGDHHEAQTAYGKALAQKPRSALVLNNLGYSHYLAGNGDRAFELYQRALDIDPESKEVWSNLALLYVRTGRYDDALQAFQSVMARHEALNAVGYLCLVNGDHERARALLRQAIDASPSYYVEAQQNLRRVRAEIERAGADGS